MEDNKLIIYKNSEGNIVVFIKMKLYGYHKKVCQKFSMLEYQQFLNI